MKFTTEQIHKKTAELVEQMSQGKDIKIGEFQYSPRRYLERLLQDGAYPGDIAILTFSKAEASIDRVEAWGSIAVFIERWAVECLEFEADEVGRQSWK